MFKYQFRTQFELTPSIKDYAINKMSKLEKYIQVDTNVMIRMSTNPDKQFVVDVDMVGKDINFRGEQTHRDLYAAIDLVEEKLERQARKRKTQFQSKLRQNVGLHELFEDQSEDENEATD